MAIGTQRQTGPFVHLIKPSISAGTGGNASIQETQKETEDKNEKSVNDYNKKLENKTTNK